MSARLTMTVSGNIRWANVSPSAFIPKAIDRIIPMAEQLNRDITPRGITGKLQDSFRNERTERTVRFYWDASYAKYVDRGTRESSGRYVPILGKRLRKESSRKIGTHPGIKGKFFSRHISNLLKVYLVDYTLDAIKEALR